MPRTGGVYSPPAGTKGTPNTTIQSVPYNTLIDDLTADANAARPVTAGGTGATSASGARTALGVEIGTNVQAYDAGLQSIAGLTTVANQMLYTTGTDLYATTALTPFARTILDDADAATMRATIGSDNASNLTTGTVNDARLPSTMTGKTFTNTPSFLTSTSTTAMDAWQARPSDYGAGKPGVFLQKTTTANQWSFNLWDGSSTSGTINFGSTNLTHNGVGVFTYAGGTLTGSLGATDIASTSGVFASRSNGNRHYYMQTAAGINRGLLYHDNTADSFIGLNLYNTSGTYVRGLVLQESGGLFWGGQMLQIGGGSGSAEARFNSGVNMDHRLIGVSGGQLYIQRSTNEWAGATDLMSFDSGSGTYFYNGVGSIYANYLNLQNLYGNGNYFGIGNGDNAIYSSHNVRVASWWGIGFWDSSSNACRIVFDTRGGHITNTGNHAIGGTMYVGSAAVFTDGNMQFAGGMAAYGTYLSDALSARAVIHMGTGTGDTSFPLGHTLIAFSNTDRNRNQAYAVYLTATVSYGYTLDASAGTQLAGTWRARGQYSTGGGNSFVMMQRVS